MLHFYDEKKNPMDTPGAFVKGSCFVIASLPQIPGQDVVGLFIIDDDNCFLQATFSSYWLPELRKLAGQAQAGKADE